MLYKELQSDGRVLSIFRQSSGLLLIAQKCYPDRRPFVHPVMAPDGVGILTEDQPAHHPWQHGIYIGLNDVNGQGFWCEGMLPSRKCDGTFHPTPIQLLPSDNSSLVNWQFDCLYRGHDGQDMLAETQAFSFFDGGELTTLDLTWSVRAEIDLRFGQYAYGGLFVRMPYRDGSDARVLSSEGANAVADAEKQRARWVAVSMKLSERSGFAKALQHATIALFDHPDNPEHPVPWRVDDQFGFGPSRCIAGEWTLKRGETARFQHRLQMHVGIPDAKTIERAGANLEERTDE